MLDAAGVHRTIEVGQVAVDGEATGGRAGHRTFIVAGVVGEGVGHGRGFAVGDLSQRADVELPVVVEVVLEMHAGGVGGVVVASVVLTQVAARRIEGVGQGDAVAAGGEFARKTFVQIVVVAQVGLDDAVVTDLKIRGQAYQLAAQGAAGGVAVALFVDQVETVLDLAFRIEGTAEVDRLEPAHAATEAHRNAVAGEVRRTLGQQVEGACRVGGAVQRAR